MVSGQLFGMCKVIVTLFVRIADYAGDAEDAEGVLVISGFLHNHQVLCNLKTEEIANFTPLLDENFMHQNHLVTETLHTLKYLLSIWCY